MLYSVSETTLRRKVNLDALHSAVAISKQYPQHMFYFTRVNARANNLPEQAVIMSDDLSASTLHAIEIDYRTRLNTKTGRLKPQQYKGFRLVDYSKLDSVLTNSHGGFFVRNGEFYLDTDDEEVKDCDN